jgi:energy-coupling factor transport system substrate-specific component
LLALLVELQGEATSAKVVAALGMLVSAASVLRFVETAIPGPGGFSPIFAPVILAGYVFGARFGFLMGSFTLLVSALITGGIGPWFPYQMFVAGWVGFSAGLLPHPSNPRLELLLLLLAGVFWGLLFGFITNLYFWPFFTGDAGQSMEAGAGVMTNVRRYLAFYAATSLLWDIARVVGNVLLLLVLGMPAVRALSRFRDRFQFALAPGSDLSREALETSSSGGHVVEGTQ